MNLFSKKYFLILSTLLISSLGISNSFADTAVGSKGPAGGIIVITPSTPGNNTNGYFEAAPLPLSTTASWCEDWSTFFGITNESIGSGRGNTDAIISKCSKSAAAIAKSYSFNGYSDWFLPSKLELLELVKIGFPVFAISMWSSSESGTETAWSVYPSSRETTKMHKESQVRNLHPIRFISIEIMNQFEAKAKADAEAKAKADADQTLILKNILLDQASRIGDLILQKQVQIKENEIILKLQQLNISLNKIKFEIQNEIQLSPGDKLSSYKSNLDNIQVQVSGISSFKNSKKKITITCVKGKLIKKIAGTSPKCPNGYKVK